MGMVDISEKKDVLRIAKTRGTIVLKSTTVDVIKSGEVKKGDVFEAAKIAGMLAVKNTPNIIPHCHPIPIESVDFSFHMHGNRIDVECEVKAHYKTGVEMEALTGVSVALLTIWDMVKYLEKDENGQYPMTQILGIEVVEKIKEE
ncbi:MAG: cyclic pyranopterin monophosphate synthase MoaC [Thermoplasmata archaeon]|nr:cyclic pyranopterin monophosphate synthase MoaC [Thermoplasmata archaeon]